MRFYQYQFDDSEVVKAWQCPDSDVKIMHAMLPKVPLSDREHIRRLIAERIMWVDSGFASIPQCYQTTLQQLDPYLRLRSDPYYDCIVIERVDTDLRAWVTIFRWANEDGSAKPLNNETITQIVDKLHAGDLRRFASPADYLKWKRSQAERRQRINESAANERILEAIDGLSSKRIDEFVNVIRALNTGEHIRPMGQDAATLNKWFEAQRNSGSDGHPPIPDDQQAVNPGHNPAIAPTFRQVRS